MKIVYTKKHRQVFVDQEGKAQRYLEYPHETQIINEIRLRESLKNRPLEMYQIIDKQKDGKVIQENINRNEKIGFVHDKQTKGQVFADQEESVQRHQEYPQESKISNEIIHGVNFKSKTPEVYQRIDKHDNGKVTKKA